MATDCDVSQQKTDIACFVNCLSVDEMEALRLYMLAQALINYNSDYADYTLDDWKELLKEWQTLSETERKALELQRAIELAQTYGYRGDTDLDSLKTSAKCYFCIPTETVQQLIAGLNCYLSIAVLQ